ncbi:MAG: ATP-binding protein, partial [Candidatus Binatia bacterium]
ELILYELRRSGFTPDWQRVETAADYLARLHEGLDTILADYTLPQFDALRALHLLQERGLDIPFIVVTGTISEEAAVECMKQGAADYLLKDRLSRLGPALTRALQEKKLRDEKRRAEAALRESEERFRLLAENSTDMISRYTPEARFLYVSPACRPLLGYAPDDLVGHSIYELFHPADMEENEKIHAALLIAPDTQTVTCRFRHKDGTYPWFETTLHSIHDPRTGAVLELHASSRDVTARKQAEEALQEDAQVSAALARVGRELISALDTPTLLDRLCQLATEVLECRYSFTALWQPREKAFMVVASWGYTAEQAEALRVLQIPGEALADLVPHLQKEDMVRGQAPGLAKLLPMLPPQEGNGVILSLALRHGQDLIGIQVCGYQEHKNPAPRSLRIAQGISQIASLALASARLIQELEQANRLKSDFLATMSHELRTPLNVIMGYTELLLENEFGSLATEQADVLRRMDKSTRELLDLILATLDVSRLEAGRLPVEIAEVCLPDLLSEIADETQDLLREKPDLSFTWQAAPLLPPLRTDRAKLKVVLKNLINNAVKFTAEGRVAVDVHTSSREQGVEIQIMDTGIGIAPDVLPHIFEMFRQGDSSTTRRYGGVGLGLYIVRQLLELLGGTVTVESAVGHGSTFCVWVPLEAA